MKLLVSLSSYGDKNLHLLNTAINEYKSYQKYDTSIEVHCTVPLTRTDIHQVVHSNPPTTCFFHRNDFVRSKNLYDLFLFSEYDIFIKESVIDTYLKYTEKLPIDYCSGFLRYENAPDSNKYFIDWWKTPGYNYIRNADVAIQDIHYFTVDNPHQACYLLTKEQLNYVIDNTDFNSVNFGGLGVESATSTIFSDWPYGPRGIMKKVYPKNRADIQNLLVHHMADCHVNGSGVNSAPEHYRNTSISLEGLFQDFNL